MNWFFTRNRIALNLDLVHSVEFSPSDAPPDCARLLFTTADMLKTQALVLVGEDAAKLFRELYSHSLE